MTINPSQFGYDVDHYLEWGECVIVLPCIEAPAKWCDADPPSKNYHRHRARTYVDIAAADILYLKFHLDHAADQDWNETQTGAIADAWTSSYAAANKTPDHIQESNAVPNETPEDESHRYVVARLRFKEDAGNGGDPQIKAFEFGWPHDNSIAAGDPDVELADRTGAHQFDAYHPASAWHIARCLLGTINRLLYESNYRMVVSMANQR